jgi:acetylornithine/succinyldiaminopimelate/putrescine aminotransferase
MLLRNHRTNSRCWWSRSGTTEFFQALEKVCKANDVVLILDEVQSGFDEAGSFLHIIMTS